MMLPKIIVWAVLLGNFASMSAAYAGSYQAAVDRLMKEKILKKDLINEEYEVSDKFFKSVLITDTTGYESIAQVIDRMADIFFTYYQEENIKFEKSDIFIRQAIVKFIDQLFGDVPPALLTSEQRAKYAALWDDGANLDVLIESFWDKWQNAGLDNPKIHDFVLYNYFHNKPLIPFILKSPAERMAKIFQSPAFQQMIANFNAPASQTSTSVVISNAVLVSPESQAATLSAVNSVLFQRDSSVSLTQEDSDSSIVFTPVDLETAFQAVRNGDATSEQVFTVLQTAVGSPEAVKQISNLGLFFTINTLMNLMYVRYGASQSILLDQHNLGQFIQDHPDIFLRLIDQGLIVVSSQTPSAKGGGVVPATGAQPALLTPTIITEIVRTVRPLYANWTLVQSSIAQTAADSLNGSQSPTSVGSKIPNISAATQLIVDNLQKGADGLIETVHHAKIIPVSPAPKSNAASVQSDVVLMVPITVVEGDQPVTSPTIPLVTTAQKARPWSQVLTNPAVLPATTQRFARQGLNQALGISPNSINTFDADLLEILSGPNDNDQISNISLSPLTPTSPSSPDTDWLNSPSQTFAQTVAQNGMIIAKALLDQNVKQVTQQNIVSVLAAKNIKIDGISNSANMAFLIGYVQNCVWILQKAATAQDAVKVSRIVLVVKQLIQKIGQARS